MDPVGAALWVLYVAAFAFYLFCRSTTVVHWAAPALLAYQLAVLVAEGLVFTSGAIIGLSQARTPVYLAIMHIKAPCMSQSRHAAVRLCFVHGAAHSHDNGNSHPAQPVHIPVTVALVR